MMNLSWFQKNDTKDQQVIKRTFKNFNKFKRNQKDILRIQNSFWTFFF